MASPDKSNNGVAEFLRRNVPAGNIRRSIERGQSPALPGGIDAPAAQAGGENFTVAAKILPPRIRKHLLSVYVFARLVDDIGDEASGNRQVLLDKISRDIDCIYAGKMPAHGMLGGLAETIRACEIPRNPFDRLIQANRQDQVVNRYATYQELLDYCELSANPVGHLVLYVFDSMTDARRDYSDRICTALQILEHCQDVAEDLDRGRIYLPAEDMRRFRVEETDLKAPRASRAVRALVAFEAQRALRLLEDGAPLVASLRGPARLAVAGYLAGGLATVSALADADYDVLACVPKPRKTRVLGTWLTSLVGPRSRRAAL